MLTPKTDQTIKKIAILGGGPSALFMLKAILAQNLKHISITIFEKKEQIGVGMPYSKEGANDEHVTNVSENEIPMLVTSIEEWAKTLDKSILDRFEIDTNNFNAYRVLPRLFFGMYLEAQFNLLLEKAKSKDIVVDVHLGCQVIDIIDQQNTNETCVETAEFGILKFDYVVICTGHNWPEKNEGEIENYFDSPYPPRKFNEVMNFPIALRGASLTAIDAVRTLAKIHGNFKEKNGILEYQLHENSENFHMVMHSTKGMLPAVRFHLSDSHLDNKSLLTEEEIATHIANNHGFLSLDYIFQKDFKQIIQKQEPEFYQQIREMNMEEFVDHVMDLREKLDPFVLLKAEYAEAEKSIKRKQSIFWKEMLGVLSFAMNYPAKYLSAEDMLRLHRKLSPLISLVIAYIPQSSCKQLLALHEAGVLSMVAVGADSELIAQKEGGIIYRYKDENGKLHENDFKAYINCVGQPHLSIDQFPFRSLVKQQIVAKAQLKFTTEAEGKKEMSAGNPDVELDNQGVYWLNVPGVAINDGFQLVDPYGAYHSRIYLMSVPYMGGFNPDYSGLDFCEEASQRIAKGIDGTQVSLMESA